MDFRVDEDQQALQEAVRSFCDGQVGHDRLPTLEGLGYDEALWKELAELGVFALRLPEQEGRVPQIF